jgi:hypothetical protein
MSSIRLMVEKEGKREIRGKSKRLTGRPEQRETEERRLGGGGVQKGVEARRCEGQESEGRGKRGLEGRVGRGIRRRQNVAEGGLAGMEEH